MTLLPARLNDKPHYVFHPVRLLRRAVHDRREAPDGGRLAVARLPWGLELEVRSREAIGFTILTAGVFDPCVTETLHRLIDPGDLVVDVGANVGYLTSLAAARAGTAGEVAAYEPHPRVFNLLARNAERWRGRPGIAPVGIHRAAISDAEGFAELSAGPGFARNMGVATLGAPAGETRARPTGTGAPGRPAGLRVAVHQLDEVLAGRRVGVLKIDVEGHEAGVLRGARRLLAAGAVRDIVFEDHRPYPDPCTDLVESAGYRLLSLENDLFGLRLVEPARRGTTRAWPGPSYLATRDPERALARLRPRGWEVPGIGLGRRRRQ